MINLKDSINEQQLLDICLSLVACEEYADEFFAGPAGIVITAQAINDIGENFTEEEISSKIHNMIVSKVLENLIKKGLVDVDLTGDEPKYKINND